MGRRKRCRRDFGRLTRLKDAVTGIFFLCKKRTLVFGFTPIKKHRIQLSISKQPRCKSNAWVLHLSFGNHALPNQIFCFLRETRKEKGIFLNVQLQRLIYFFCFSFFVFSYQFLFFFVPLAVDFLFFIFRLFSPILLLCDTIVSIYASVFLTDLFEYMTENG